MRSLLITALISLCFANPGPVMVAAREDTADCWPQFRGPGGDGHSEAKGLPLVWSETKNIKWKTPIHDEGRSSPVIWESQVWVTTAAKDGKVLYAVCVDRDTGKVVHDIKVFDVEKPQDIWGQKNGHASPTPVIEAGRVYVHFGTCGTACLDTRTGQKLWARQDLNCFHRVGPASSPIICDNLLIFHVDGCDVRYVVALDKATGKTVWKTDRSADYEGAPYGFRYACCTPTVTQFSGRRQMISPTARAVIAYDPLTGEELWKVTTRGWAVVPRPVVGHGLAFVSTDHNHPEVRAVRLDGRGDVSDSHVVWSIAKGAPSIPSLLLVGELLYLISDQGIASCVEAKSGQIVWKERLPGPYRASPIYADGRIYITNVKGATTVIEPGRRLNVLAVNQVDGTTQLQASLATAGKALFLRTERHLYRIEE
jgi:outer membrane protein assembly factor BamB